MIFHESQDGPGYVYFIRFEHAKNCYKMGSTNNIDRRLSQFGRHYVELIVCGTTKNKLETELKIQNMFREYNNNQNLYRRTKFGRFVDYQHRGDINSTEHFIFPHTSIVCEVICTFEDLCDSVQLGSENKYFCSKDHRKPIGYGEERLKFYDEENHRYIPYPTKFENNGWPIFPPYEEWDSIPYVGLEPEYKEIIIHK